MLLLLMMMMMMMMMMMVMICGRWRLPKVKQPIISYPIAGFVLFAITTQMRDHPINMMKEIIIIIFPKIQHE